MTHFNMNADYMRTDLGYFPYYLYDKNPFNDVEYLLNRNNIETVYTMISDSHKEDFVPGITSFNYSNSQYRIHGKNAIITEPKVLINSL